MDYEIVRAESTDVGALVRLSSSLSREDAGVRDPFTDVGWPEKEGWDHFLSLISGDDAVCLLAKSSRASVGYLAGYLKEPTALRPVKVADFQSMYVQESSRNRGVGSALVEEFLGREPGGGADLRNGLHGQRESHTPLRSPRFQIQEHDPGDAVRPRHEHPGITVRRTRFLTGSGRANSLPVMSVEYLLTSLVVVLIPGTGVIYTVASSIGGGRRCGLFAAVGCTLGIVPHMLAAMLGLSGILQAGAVPFEVVRWAGVAYLVLVGASMIRNAGDLTLEDENVPTGPAGPVVWRGVLLKVLNPKLTLFFFAFLPQFLDASPGLLDPKLIWLGGIFMLMTLAVFAVYALASAAIRDLALTAPLVRRWIERAFGAFLIGFAARLAITDR